MNFEFIDDDYDELDIEENEDNCDVINDELAVIFNILYDKDTGIINFYASHIAIGHFDKKSYLFKDDMGEEYFHIYDFNDEDSYCFGFRTKLSEFDLENMSLADIQTELLNRYNNANLSIYRNVTEPLVYILNTSNGIPMKQIFIDEDSRDIALGDEEEYSVKGNVVSMFPIKKMDSENLDFIALNEELKASIIGQDEAIKYILGTLYHNFKKPEDSKKLNMLLGGKPGVGKTEIFRIISKYYPCFIEDVSGLSQSGYEGSSVEDIFASIYTQCKYDLEVAQRSIVVLDEIDKKAGYYNDKASVSGVTVLNELLKKIEGDNFTFQFKHSRVPFNTYNTTFAVCGAFEGLNLNGKGKVGFNNETIRASKNITTALLEYGLTTEFLRRCPVIHFLNDLSYEDLLKIGSESLISPFKELGKTLESMGIELIYSDEIISEIASYAYELKLGASGLKSVLSKMTPLIFYDLSVSKDKKKKVRLLEGCSSNPENYKLS